MAATGNDTIDRDRDILEHVARYRITTSEVLTHLFCRTANATKKVMKRLAAPVPAAGLSEAEEQKLARPFPLQARELLGKRLYYHLSPRGALRLRLHPARRHAKPPGPQALIGHYAILIHCCLHDDQRILFTRKELAEQLPAVEHYAPYCLERHDGSTRLVRMVVDHNRAPEGLVEKCRQIVRDAQAVPFLGQRLRAGQYAIALLTTDDLKVAAIATAAQQAALSVPVMPVTIPDLLGLIVGRKLHA